jgi:hypothetical protein
MRLKAGKGSPSDLTLPRPYLKKGGDMIKWFKRLFKRPSIDISRFVYICPKCNAELAVYPNICVPCQNGWRKEAP